MNSDKIARVTIACFDEYKASTSGRTFESLVGCGVLWSRHTVIGKQLQQVLERINVKDQMTQAEVVFGYSRISAQAREALKAEIAVEIELLRAALRPI